VTSLSLSLSLPPSLTFSRSRSLSLCPSLKRETERRVRERERDERGREREKERESESQSHFVAKPLSIYLPLPPSLPLSLRETLDACSLSLPQEGERVGRQISLGETLGRVEDDRVLAWLMERIGRGDVSTSAPVKRNLVRA
jgi:hypothetical protein